MGHARDHGPVAGAEIDDRLLLADFGIPVQFPPTPDAHATTVGIVGLVVGIPLGLVAGRQLWRWVATSVPFLYVGPVAGLAALAAVPVALVIANVVAFGPGRSAARIRPAEELRSE